MDPIDLAESFGEYCGSTRRIDHLTRRFQQNLENLGFRYYACSTHVDPLDPHEGLTFLNYPRPWVEWYSEQQMHLIDPVFKRADRSRLPFHWDEPAFLKSMTHRQRRMQRDARQFGVANGFTVPIHSPMSTASCSLVPDTPKLDKRTYLAVSLMSVNLFDRVEHIQYPEQMHYEVREFSTRQKHCLYFAATGKTDPEIAMLLGIQECTAHNYMGRALKRFSLSDRIQAVMYAVGTRQIRIEGVMRHLHRIVSQSRR